VTGRRGLVRRVRRKLTYQRLIPLLALSALLLASTPALACSCRADPTASAKKYAEGADAAFHGRVERITYLPDEGGFSSDLEIEFATAEWWSGEPSPAVRVRTPSTGGACGLPGIVEGAELVIYAHGRGGVLLVVPEGSEAWRQSIVHPTSYEVSPPFNELSLLAGGPADGVSQRAWREELNRSVAAFRRDHFGGRCGLFGGRIQAFFHPGSDRIPVESTDVQTRRVESLDQPVEVGFP